MKGLLEERQPELEKGTDTASEIEVVSDRDRELSEFTGKLAALKTRLEKACLKVAMGI